MTPNPLTGRVDVDFRTADGLSKTACFTDDATARHYTAGIDKDDKRTHRQVLRRWSYRPCQHLQPRGQQ